MYGDGFRLRQVVSNLLGNALKFTKTGFVRVSCSYRSPNAENGAWLEYSVEDTGIGIPQDQLGLIFERFGQLDASSTKRFGGVGLGLSISKGLVELMGGSIQVESQPGQGSRFTFSVPVQEGPEAHNAGVPAPENHQELQKEHPGRILLAEDDPTSSLVIQRFLQKHGWEVTTAANGKEAFEKYCTGLFKAILLDCQMPEMDGYETASAIRAREGQRQERTRIIAVTAYSLKRDLQKCFEAGMDACLSKPVKLTELLAALEE